VGAGGTGTAGFTTVGAGGSGTAGSTTVGVGGSGVAGSFGVGGTGTAGSSVGAGGSGTAGTGVAGSGVGGAPGGCGDGVVDPGEQCDLGSANVTLHALTQGPPGGLTPTWPLYSGQDVVAFYNYFGGSSHTGYEQTLTAYSYFYRQLPDGALSLVIHMGRDAQIGQPSQPEGYASMTLSGLPLGTYVAVADDGQGEVKQVSSTQVECNWHFQSNTDGLLLSGLPFPGDWDITLDATFTQGIDAWYWYDPSTTFLPVKQSVFGPDLHLVAHSTASACRADCTVPQCGDGVWDAGEMCDDGNKDEGDSCASDCSRQY
jgi:cysteine-rich repeat protein